MLYTDLQMHKRKFLPIQYAHCYSYGKFGMRFMHDPVYMVSLYAKFHLESCKA